MKNKKGIGRELSFFYWFIIAVVIVLAFVIVIIIHVKGKADIRGLKAESLAYNLRDCLYENIDELPDELDFSNFDIFDKCKINKKSISKDD